MEFCGMKKLNMREMLQHALFLAILAVLIWSVGSVFQTSDLADRKFFSAVSLVSAIGLLKVMSAQGRFDQNKTQAQ
jgi:hypothetical protein